MNAADLTELKINILKFRADGDRYFSLFDKHIPVGLEAGKKILLYKIGNLTTIARIIEKNPAAEYSIHDRKCICDGMHALCKADIRDFPANGQDRYDIFEDKDMKFDCIIMNPPYCSGLHIKILAEATRHSTEGGKVISLQPIDKWQEAMLYSKDLPVSKSVVLEKFNSQFINEIFGISSAVSLGIVSNFGETCNIIKNYELLKKLKIKTYEAELNDRTYLDNVFEQEASRWPVVFLYGCSAIKGGKTSYRLCSVNESVATKNNKNGHIKKYYAKDAVEQHRVWKFYQNPIIRFIVKEFGFGNIRYSIIVSGIKHRIIPFVSEFKDENCKTPLDMEWSIFKIAKWFDLTKQDLIYI